MFQRIILYSLFIFTAMGCGRNKDIIIPTFDFRANGIELIQDSTNHLNYCVYKPQQAKMAVVFLDPQGETHKPIVQYKSLADTFGFALYGLNDFKNGADLNMVYQKLQQLIGVISERDKIAKRNIVLMGFSGGSRAAEVIANADTNIYYVIGNGAGFNEITNNRKFLVNNIGRYDFNYQEAVRTAEQLSRLGVKYFQTEYDGKHEWASVDAVYQSWALVKVEAMHLGQIPFDSAWIQIAMDRFKTTANELHKKKDMIGYKIMLEKMVFLSQGFKEHTILSKSYINIEQSTIYAQQLNERILLQQKELAFIRQLPASFEKDVEWWKKHLSKLKDKSENATSLDEQAMYKRLINFMEMYAFILSDRAIQEKIYSKATHYLDIYQLINPNNPDVYYLQAILLVQTDNVDKAIQMMKKSVSKGFDNASKILTDNRLEPIHSFVQTSSAK